MNGEFKQWIEANKLTIVKGHMSYEPRLKYSMLPIINTVIYRDPYTFQPEYVYRLITKEGYDELLKMENKNK